MSKTYKIYNLIFLDREDFTPFKVYDYQFYPINNKQPNSMTVNTLSYNRKMHVTAYVEIPSKQLNSIFRKGGIYNQNRKIKFIEDILMIISLLIGRNVVPSYFKIRNEFPLCSIKHCENVIYDSDDLSNQLAIAIEIILTDEWQQKYNNGFHLGSFYNASNIMNIEARFLADITIWENLFFCNNTNMSFEELRKKKLYKKIGDLVFTYLQNINSRNHENFKIFYDIRNQLSHYGKIPISNPKSQFQNLEWNACQEYMKLFKALTQALVLKTIGINILDRLTVFSPMPYRNNSSLLKKLSQYDPKVESHLLEVCEDGYVKLFQELDSI